MAAPLVKTPECPPGVYRRGSRYVFSYRLNGKQRWESCATVEEAARLKEEYLAKAAEKRRARRLRALDDDDEPSHRSGRCTDCGQLLVFVPTLTDEENTFMSTLRAEGAGWRRILRELNERRAPDRQLAAHVVRRAVDHDKPGLSRCAYCMRLHRRQMASLAADAHSVLSSERRLLKTEAEITAVQQQRKRAQRAAKALIESGSPSEKSIGKSYTLILKAAQELHRGAAAAEGLAAVRLRAAQQSLYEVEDGVRLAILGDETETYGRFRAA